MRINFPYYVETRKLPRSKALHPVFEAISNSIDAIDEQKNGIDGKIIVTIARAAQGLLEDNEENRELLPIVNISIEDNGVGFRRDNFNAFSELSTIWKKDKGGKGLGRVIWLKVFDHAEIQSTFLDGDDLNHIHFRFLCEEEPIVILNESNSKTGEIRTIVKLINCKQEYIDAIPKRRLTIAEEIITHFLPYFMVTGVPDIILREERFEDINLNLYFDDYISAKGERVQLSIKDELFDVMHTKSKYHSQRISDHRIFYVANGRVVESEIATPDKVSNIPPRLSIGDEDHVYIGYVESEFLDNNVNQARDGFDIPKSIDEPDMFQEIDWNEIQQEVHSSVQNYLGDYLDAALAEKVQKIKDYINNKAPNYSYIYKYHKEQIDKIPYQSIQKGRIEQELHRVHTALRTRLNEEAEKVLSLPDDELSAEEYKQRITTIVEQLNPAGKADLAEYIIHRRIVLDLLDKSLKRKKDGRFEKEDVIHSYIFPIKSSTDEIEYEDHNLWLLDERLAYNSYIASDKEFGQIPGYEELDSADKRKRPDIYAYAYVTVEPDQTRTPFKSLDVFEFKRPMRDDYTDDENPYSQVRDYLEIIRRKNATTKDGRSFSVIEGGVIYCHIVCDFTTKLRTMLNKEDFEQVGNEDWYFRFHKTYNAIIEVKSFDFVLETAIKRNRILFEKLGLD